MKQPRPFTAKKLTHYVFHWKDDSDVSLVVQAVDKHAAVAALFVFLRSARQGNSTIFDFEEPQKVSGHISTPCCNCAH